MTINFIMLLIYFLKSTFFKFILIFHNNINLRLNKKTAPDFPNAVPNIAIFYYAILLICS